MKLYHKVNLFHWILKGRM